METIRSIRLTLALATLVSIPLCAMNNDVPNLIPKATSSIELLSSNDQLRFSSNLQDIRKNLGCPDNLCAAIARLHSTFELHLATRMLSTALANSGISLNQVRNSNGWTSLHSAVILGDKRTVKILLEADETLLLERDSKGGTALHWAAYQNKADIIDTLVTFAINRFRNTTTWLLFIATNTWGHTALHNAAYRNHSESVKALLVLASHTFDNDTVKSLICITATDGQTAYSLANDDIRQIMKQYWPVDEQATLSELLITHQHNNNAQHNQPNDNQDDGCVIQ